MQYLWELIANNQKPRHNSSTQYGGVVGLPQTKDNLSGYTIRVHFIRKTLRFTVMLQC